MAVLPIITAPDPRLKQVCDPVQTVDAGIQRLMDDMLETMYSAPGIGLAAIQVGVAKNVIVIDIGDENEERDPVYLVNPEILAHSDTLAVFSEGCLSLPDEYADVERPDWVRIRYRDYHGTPRETEASGLLATCIQHEMDHLKGILFVDHLSSLKRKMILRRLQKARRLAAAE